MIDKEKDRPLISVVIPVKNGAGWLPKTIAAILSQTLASQTEIIVIDSGSTDGTLEILEKFAVRVFRIAPETFNHGATRNLGVQYARGQFVLMTVQDAAAVDNRLLENLIEPFSDPVVAGVCGQQIVAHDPDNNPVEWFRPLSPPTSRKYYFPDPRDFEKLSGKEKLAICRWDDVIAMYRREILLTVPFQTVDFAEDVLWSRDALMQGYAIVYQPRARVYHYHFETPEYVFRRKFTEHYHFYKFFGVLPEEEANGPIEILRNIKLFAGDRQLTMSGRLKWIRFNYKRRKAINLAVKTFKEAIVPGTNKLEVTYAKISKVPVQALNRALINI